MIEKSAIYSYYIIKILWSQDHFYPISISFSTHIQRGKEVQSLVQLVLALLGQTLLPYNIKACENREEK